MARRRDSIDKPSGIDQERPERPPLSIAEVTEASIKHPERNEDATFASAERRLLGLSDGAGGHAGGDVMSREAMTALAEIAEELPDGGVSIDELSRDLDQAFRNVATRVHKASKTFASEHGVPHNERPMATLMIAKLLETPEGYAAVVKSVGDSAGYVLRRDGSLERVDIKEDSFLQTQVDGHVLSEEDADLISESVGLEEFLRQLVDTGRATQKQIDLLKHNRDPIKQRAIEKDRPDMAAVYKLFRLHNGYFSKNRSGVTQMAGERPAPELNVHSAVVMLSEGDRLFFTSDGVHDNLTFDEIQELMQEDGTFAERLQRVKDAAVARSKQDPTKHQRAKPDDVTAVGIEVPERTQGAVPSSESGGAEEEPAALAERANQMREDADQLKMLLGAIESTGTLAVTPEMQERFHEMSREAAELEMNRLLLEAAKLEAKFAHGQFERFRDRVPMRLRAGSRVRVPRSDGTIDELDVGWKITSVEKETGSYVVGSELLGAEKKIPRETLEPVQGDRQLLPKKGEVRTITLPSGRRERGWVYAGLSDSGRATFTQEVKLSDDEPGEWSTYLDVEDVARDVRAEIEAAGRAEKTAERAAKEARRLTKVVLELQRQNSDRQISNAREMAQKFARSEGQRKTPETAPTAPPPKKPQGLGDQIGSFFKGLFG